MFNLPIQDISSNISVLMSFIFPFLYMLPSTRIGITSRYIEILSGQLKNPLINPDS